VVRTYRKYLFVSLVGDIASMVGVLIALIGFGITIRNVRKSREAAGRAEIAANMALERVRYVDTVQNLSKAISIIEEIQRLNRAKEWKILLDRHLVFRGILTEIRGIATELGDDHRAFIQDGITQSNSMSNRIEIALDEDTEPTSVPRMNRILSKQVENLGIILAEMRKETDG